MAKYFYDLAETARNEGILSLEERICDDKKCVLDENGKRAFSKDESRIFYEGLSLVLEGTDGREVRAILENLIARTAVGSAGECDVSPNPRGAFSPFSFDGIAFLSNTAIQNALRALDSQTLSLALKDAPFSVLRKILGNMSKTSAKMLCDDIEHLAFASQSQIFAAREKIVSVFVRLHKDGEIVSAPEKNETEFYPCAQ